MFKHDGLSILAYANGFTLWHYRTEDELVLVKLSQYFSPASDMLHTGDAIMCNASNGNETLYV